MEQLLHGDLMQLVSVCDINKDGSINMLDIVEIAKHFNQTADSYLKAINLY